MVSIRIPLFALSSGAIQALSVFSLFCAIKRKNGTISPKNGRLVKKFVRHFDRVARLEYGLTRPCYTNYSGSTRLRVIADQYRNRPTILRLPKMNTASRRPDRPQNQNESSVPSRYRTRLSANAAKKSIELQ